MAPMQPMPPMQPMQPMQPMPMRIPPTPLEGYAFPLASRGKRFGALMLDLLLLFCTCYIGWIIWALIVWKDGQSPAKQILKMRIYGTEQGRPANWAHMAIRSFLIPQTVNIAFLPFWISILNGSTSFEGDYYFTFGYIFGVLISMAYSITEYVTIFTSPLNQRLSDRLAKTVVLDESFR
jgi:uncharacterized RDD family membrane protein YckC